LETLELPTIVVSLLQSICFCGLARAAQLGIELNFSAEEYAQKSLKITLESDLVTDAPGIYIWTSSSTLSTCIRNHLSVSRQLVADSLLRAGRPEQAQSFLEAAVRDSPMDAEAAFALGAFRLRMALLSKVKSPDAIKAAQIQLLKAAKLDAGKANPFALLGVWFEEQGDLKRALGCYSKALGGDPPNPVAGRGILRLQSFDESKAFIDAAINTNSPLNGWAWRAVGSHKVMVDGQDDLAVVALLKALRCRDIEVPRNEALGIFYQLSGGSVISERAGALAELAMCYRRLGRFTAAIRAFHAAIEAAGESIASSVLCSCAQGTNHKKRVGHGTCLWF
jgi:tetratricopeptide (TPR) repeat protein